jgi:hypothetical protein
VPFELNISCKKGMNKTKERRLKTVKSKLPRMVRMASKRYLNANPKICEKAFIFDYLNWIRIIQKKISFYKDNQ